MYQYRSNQPSRRKRGLGQIALPFIIILLLVGILWAGWSLINRVRTSDNREASKQGIQVLIDSGNVKGKTATEDDWVDFINNREIYGGEKLKVSTDGQATLFYSSAMELRLDGDTTLGVTDFEEKEGQYTAATNIEEGLVWASLGSLSSSNSTFTLTTEYLTITADNAKFAVEAPGTVYMIEGQASVEIMNEEKPVKSLTLRVGQQLIVDSSTLADLENGESDDLFFALDDDFKRSSFYRWNAEEDGLITSEEIATPDDEDTPDDSTDEVTPDDKIDEDTPDDTTDDTPVTGEVKITAPSENSTHNMTTLNFDLEAKVPKGTATVKVGGYQLQQFTKGDTIARYYARQSTGNTKEGANTYTFSAFDDNGKTIGSDTITITIKLDSTQDTTDSNTPSGTVSITAPGNTSSTSTFDVKATVPNNTAKVEVNGYTLSQYSAGSTTAVYRVKPANNNVKEGDNTYTVIAYDGSGNKLGSDSITVKVNTSGTTDNTPPPTDTTVPTLSAAFTYPVASGTYSTTLSPIQIQGSVSKDVRNLYVNGSPLGSHSLGNTSWSTTIELKTGLNQIQLYGEDNANNSTGTKTLTIDYQG